MEERRTKKERRELKKEEEFLRFHREQRTKTFLKWGIIAVVVTVIAVGGWWVIKESNKPLPGQFFENQGRDHVTQEKWDKFKYNSNPPTSGPHDPVWTKAGIYNKPQGDGHLVHSLEHGYVIISYNCKADEKSCTDLVKQLSDVANEQKLWKLILVPRPELDTRIALTAWTRIDKFNTFDKDRMVNFISAFRDHGPEQTME